MCLWKFRIDIPGDPPDITVVTSVLARYPARLLNMAMEPGCHQATGEFVVDLPHGEAVGPILAALHDLSPRVLISREKTCLASHQPSRAPVLAGRAAGGSVTVISPGARSRAPAEGPAARADGTAVRYRRIRAERRPVWRA